MEQSQYVFIGTVKTKSETSMGISLMSRTGLMRVPTPFWFMEVEVVKPLKGNLSPDNVVEVRASQRVGNWEQGKPMLFFVNELNLSRGGCAWGSTKKVYTYIGDALGVLALDTVPGKLFKDSIDNRLAYDKEKNYKKWGQRRLDVLISEFSEVESAFSQNAYQELMDWPGASDFATEINFESLREKWKSSELGSKDWIKYLRLLGHLKDRKSKKLITQIADTNKGAMRMAALNALLNLGVKRSLDKWVEDLQDTECTLEDIIVRLKWGRSLPKRERFKFAVAIVENHPVCERDRAVYTKNYIRYASDAVSIAERMLWTEASPKDAPVLAKLLELDNKAARWYALTALAPLKYKPAVPIYRKLIEHEDAGISSKAAEALSPFMSDKEKNELALPLAKSLKPPSPGNIMENMMFIGGIDAPGTALILISMYDQLGDNWSGRTEIISALKGNPHPDVRPFFWRVINDDPNERCIQWSVDGIAMDLQPGDYDRLVKLLDEKSFLVQEGVVKALVKIGDAKALPLIRSIYPKPVKRHEPENNTFDIMYNIDLRKAIVVGLREMKDPDALQIFERALNEKDFWYKEEAIRGLVQLGTPQAREVLLQYARRVRKVSEWTLFKDFILSPKR